MAAPVPPDPTPFVSCVGDEARIAVRCSTRSSRPGFGGVRSGVLVVRLASPPVGGRANREVVRALAKRLGIAAGRVRVARGERSKNKVLAVADMTVARVAEAFEGSEER